MLKLEYSIQDHGWAWAHIENQEKQRVCITSYLHDTLKELAESAIGLRDKPQKSVVFMDEPGEHQLILQKTDSKNIEYELRWYQDWASWGMQSAEDYEVVMQGTTGLVSYINQVRNVLIRIMEELGPAVYKQRWVEHDFPMTAYNKLVGGHSG